METEDGINGSINWNLKRSNESSEPKSVTTIARVRNALTAEARGKLKFDILGIICYHTPKGGGIMPQTRSLKTPTQIRMPGLDLYRCMAFLFVTGVHAFLYNGFYSQPQEGIAMWAANSARWLFYGCNGMFMLLTGYLKSTKPVNKAYFRGLLTVLVGYVLTCVISYPIRHFLLGEKESVRTWLERFVTFSNYAWYIEMYIGLILLSPIVNLAMKQLQDQQLWWLLGGMLLLTALPTITPANILPDDWQSLYPLTYYVIGAAIHRLQPKLPSWAALVCAAISAGFTGLLTLLTASGGKFNDGFSQGGYGGFLTTVTVTFLFLGVYRLRAGKVASKILAWMAGGVLEGYILSRLFDVWIYGKFKAWHTPGKYILIFVCVTVPVFLVSMAIGHYVHKLSVLLTKPRKKNTERS